MNTGSPQLVRQWLLLKMLSGKGVGQTVERLAVELEVTDKTIRRDLTVFRDAGFPVEEQAGHHGRKTYRIDPKWQRSDLSFTYDEALALYLGRRYLGPLAGTMVGEAAEGAYRKIRAVLSPQATRYLSRLEGAFCETHFGLGDYASQREILDTLLIGIEDRHVVFITYRSQSSTEPVTYDVHPYSLTRHRYALYLIGFKPDDGQVRTWKVDRIERANLDAMPFTRPDDFDPETYLAGSLGIYHGDREIGVRIHFTPAVARYVEETRWHASQSNRRQEDGGLIVEMRLSSTVELKSWLLGFGRHAEVLEPVELRDEMREELRQALEAYEGHSKKEQSQRDRLEYPD